MNSHSVLNHFTLSSMQKKIESWVMLCLLIFLLGYFFFPSSSKHNTFFYITVCFPVVLLIPYYYKRLRPTHWVTTLSLLLILYLFINSLWSIHYSTSQSLKYLRYAFTLYCFFAAVFILQRNKPNYSELIFKAFVIIGFLNSCYGIFEHFSSHQNPLKIRYNDPIDSSMLAGLLLLTSFWLMAKSNSWRQNTLYFFLLIPFVIIMLLAKSRGPQFALLLTLPLIAYLQWQNIKKLIYLFLILILILSLLLIFSDLSSSIFSRGLTAPYRIDIWQVSLAESFDYFWLGQGASHKPPIFISSGEKFSHSHNILLSIFRMGGIVGALLFSTQLFFCFFSGLKNNNPADKFWTVWLVFGFLCLMTNGKYPLIRPSSLWMAYWIPVAFICASHSNFLAKKVSGRD